MPVSVGGCVQRVLGLDNGRGFAKAPTDGVLPKSCEVQHETTPRLRQIALCAGDCTALFCFLFF